MAKSSSSAVDNQYWQTKYECFSKRLTYARDSGWQSDVTFLVGQQEPETFKAHRFILALTSPVFEAMLCGDWNDFRTDKTVPITIPDVTPKSFEVMLRYLYDSSSSKFVCQGSLQELCDLYRVADKYSIDGLCDRCVDAIGSLITVQSVCDIHEFAVFHSRNDLEARCTTTIDSKLKEVLTSRGFRQISSVTLEGILNRIVDLPISSNQYDPYSSMTHVSPQGYVSNSAQQVGIFNAICKWAKAHCKIQGLPNSPKNMRDVLGHALFKIRYSVITATDFINGPGRSGLFTADEKFALISNIIVHSMPLPPGFR